MTQCRWSITKTTYIDYSTDCATNMKIKLKTYDNTNHIYPLTCKLVVNNKLVRERK